MSTAATKVRVRRIVLASALMALVLGNSAYAGNILLTQFDYGASTYEDMKNNLEADGNTVTIVDARGSGNLATALASSDYDSLFLFDLTSTRYLNQDDIDAVEAFYGDHDSVVIDARSYGYYFQGNDPSEVALLQNVAHAFDDANGGIWFGTDHAPDWTQNANPVLEQLGFHMVSGIHSEAVNTYDPESVLLEGVTTTDLWGEGESIGNVSLGIQPNGVEMQFHFGHSSEESGSIPYISASFGNFEAPYPPCSCPEPTALAILGLGLAGISVSRRMRTAK